MRRIFCKSMFIALALAFVLSALTFTGVQAKELVIGANNQPGNINPLVGLNINAEYVAINVYDTLVGRGQKMSDKGYLIEDSNVFTPGLAKEWSISDDGLTYKFNLRKNVCFHNGNKFDGEDVKFTFKLMQEKGSYAEYFSNLLAEVSVVDAFTVKITLSHAEANFLRRISTYNACIMDKETVINNGGSDIDSQMEWLAANAIGTGPYVLESLDTNTVKLKANKDYYGEMGNLDRVILKTISEASNRRIMVEKGDIQIATSPAQTDYTALENNKDVDLLVRPGNSKIVYFAMNTNQKPFDNIKLRKAIAHAVPYEALCKIVAGGDKYAPGAKSILTSELPGFKAVYDYKYNLDKARKLIKEAGYEDGLEIQFDLFSAGTYPKCAVMLQSELKKIGIDMKIKKMAPPAFFQTGAAGNLNFLICSWWDNVADPVGLLTDLTHSKSIPDQGNWAQISDMEIDRLLDAAREELDPVKREKLVEKVQELVNEKVGYIPVWEAKIIMAMRKNVTGYVHYSDALFRFNEMSIK